MFAPTEANTTKREAIRKFMAAMPYGGRATFRELSDAIGIHVSGAADPQYRWAYEHAVQLGCVIRSDVGSSSFRRLSPADVAVSADRIKRVRTQAKAGMKEASTALAVNDLRIQALASVTAAKLSLVAAIKPTTNRDIPSDRI